MGIPFLHHIDLHGNQLINAALESLSSDPSDPATGRLWFDTADGRAKLYDGADVLTLEIEGHDHVEADITDLDKYTQAEVDALLAGKSDNGHTHDDRYYTESEADTLLAAKSDTGHTHTESEITDLDKYTQAEVDALVAGSVGDADTLDGQHGAYYLNRTNHTGDIELEETDGGVLYEQLVRYDSANDRWEFVRRVGGTTGHAHALTADGLRVWNEGDDTALSELIMARTIGAFSSISYEGRLGVGSTGNPVLRRLASGSESGRLTVGGADVYYRYGAGATDYAIAEAGSNGNGRYIRFYNGIQICWITNMTLNTVASASYINDLWTYPAAFTSAPHVSPSGGRTSGSDYSGVNLNDYDKFTVSSPGTTSSTVGIWVNAGNAAAADEVFNTSWMAIGPWY